MMDCQAFEQELGDYVDGSLPPDRKAAVDAHLLTCAACRATIADFTSIRSMARTLEPHLPPPRVWTRLSAAVEDERQRRPLSDLALSELAWWRLATGGFAWRPVAAVAVMLTLLAGGSWLAWHDTAAAARVATATPSGVVAVNADVQLAERDLTTAISSLEQVTKTEADSLDPQTAQVVQANIAVIDQAIGSSRQALQSQPQNSAAQESLFDAMRSKIQLLQDVVALINEMRKGNPEGAARIMSGKNP